VFFLGESTSRIKNILFFRLHTPKIPFFISGHHSGGEIKIKFSTNIIYNFLELKNERKQKSQGGNGYRPKNG
jgi:hypothetical protein